MPSSGLPAFPFQASTDVLEQQIDHFVDATIGSLQSYYLTMPLGNNFTAYAGFKGAYQVLARDTNEFAAFTPENIRRAMEADPLVFVVLRCILGFSPPELAHLAAEDSGLDITQGFVRSLDKRAREGKPLFTNRNATTAERITAMIRVACHQISDGASQVRADTLHRLNKVDTNGGLTAVQRIAREGVPYPTLLYERFLGRPFASHRDAVSEKVGDIIEDEIEQQLLAAGVPFYKTGRMERIDGFDQAPDFFIPSKEEPIAIIEAKLTEDDGTARDKVTRVQHLRELSDRGTGFEVIACIDGRGFTIRTEDMKKLLLATRGKVYSMNTLGHLVSTTSLSEAR